MAQKTITKTQKGASTRAITFSLLAGIALIIGGLLINQPSSIAEEIVVYKSPTCGCCTKWVDHLEDNGFSVKVHNRSNMGPIKAELGVPRHLQSCHTAKVSGYVVEGHVPADEITRLLTERPQVRGLAVPGMPMGSPGMEGLRKDAYDVLAIQDNGRTTVYARR